MDHTIEHDPAFAQVEVELAPGEGVRAEGGALVSHSDGVDIDTSATGGLISSVKRSMLGGESMFMNTFSAPDGGRVTLAPPLPGDVLVQELAGETLYAQSGAFLAGSEAVDVDTSFGGAKTFLGGKGMFLVKLTGDGPVFLSSYGAATAIDLDPGETHIVDTGHVVAFEGSVDYDVSRVGGLRSTLLSGEGLVCRLTGPGRIWVQSRSPDAFLSWLAPRLPGNDE